MQSLMGDRILKWFLKSSARRLRRSSSKRVESEPESERALTVLPETTSDHSTTDVVQPQSEDGPQDRCGETQVPDELESNSDFLAEDAALVSSDRMQGSGS